ncbi:Nse4 C-terminal-domain-containing protein [Phellopilus nigrolimitatus]|nr:Nse4 C-terminal-domain-containing protein [Phellopilus nigrolimitatus]
MEVEANSQRSDLAYDPDQDRDEKREIRKNYRSLQEDESLLSANAIGVDSLTQRIQAADKLFKRVKGPQEATLDSAFLVTASNLGAAKARQMRADAGGFDVDDFVAKLVTFMGGRWEGEERIDADDETVEFEADQTLNWELIGRRALAKSRRVPATDFMLGPLSVEQKKRTVVKRTRLEKSDEVEKRPQELKEDDIEKSENETTKNVVMVENFLTKQKAPINIFRLIVNPQSFGQSVENLFYLSFLIRDGKAALEIDVDSGEPIVWLCEAPTDQDYAEGLRKKQMVMELDVETWKKAIEVFDIKESAMPTRKAARTKLGGKWYG